MDGLNRRGFLRMLGLGAAAAVAPTKAYSFLGGILRPRPTFDPQIIGVDYAKTHPVEWAIWYLKTMDGAGNVLWSSGPMSANCKAAVDPNGGIHRFVSDGRFAHIESDWSAAPPSGSLSFYQGRIT